MLELKNVCKTFHPHTPSEKRALKNLNLTLEEGDFVTVIGGNGAGKSTMLNAIAGVWPIDSGSVLIGGEDVTRLPEHKRAVYLKKPRLLLLDEHTAALDPKTAAKVLELSDKIVRENNLTALMVTHNMKDAIVHGNRLIMMCDGRVILDIKGEEKAKLTVDDLLQKFSVASGSEFVNDRALLG